MSNRLISSFRSSNFLKSISLLASGSIIAQAISLLASPIMTRLYTSEQIGEYTLVLTAVGLFGSIISIRYDMAIVNEDNDQNVNYIVALSAICALILSIVVSIGYALYYATKGYNALQILTNSLFIFMLLIFTGVSNIAISYNNRFCEYKLMTSVNVIRTIANQGTMILCGLIYPSAISLLISQILGTIFGIRRQTKSLKENTNKYKSIRSCKFKGILTMAKKHYKQAVYSTPSLLANNFSYSSINIFIEALFGTVVLGYYSFSYRLLGLPLTVVSSNVSRVYYEEAARQHNLNQSYNRLFAKASLFLLAIAIPMVAILMLLSPVVFKFILGNEYEMAGVYVRILSPMFGIRFIVSPLSVGAIVSNKQGKELLFQVMFAVISIATFILIKTLSLSVVIYLICLSVLYSIVYLVYYLFLYKISKKEN